MKNLILKLVKIAKKYRFVTVAFSSMVTDFWYAWYNYALTHDWIILQGVIAMLLPFFGFFTTYFFIEEKSVIGRVKVTFASAIGYAVGSTLLMIMLRAGIGHGTAL